MKVMEEKIKEMQKRLDQNALILAKDSKRHNCANTGGIKFCPLRV